MEQLVQHSVRPNKTSFDSESPYGGYWAWLQTEWNPCWTRLPVTLLPC